MYLLFEFHSYDFPMTLNGVKVITHREPNLTVLTRAIGGDRLARPWTASSQFKSLLLLFFCVVICLPAPSMGLLWEKSP